MRVVPSADCVDSAACSLGRAGMWTLGEKNSDEGLWRWASLPEKQRTWLALADACNKPLDEVVDHAKQCVMRWRTCGASSEAKRIRDGQMLYKYAKEIPVMAKQKIAFDKQMRTDIFGHTRRVRSPRQEVKQARVACDAMLSPEAVASWHETRTNCRRWRVMCAFCFAESDHTLKRCSRCKGPRYCDTACQRADWARHQLKCDVRRSIFEDEKLTIDSLVQARGLVNEFRAISTTDGRLDSEHLAWKEAQIADDDATMSLYKRCKEQEVRRLAWVGKVEALAESGNYDVSALLDIAHTFDVSRSWPPLFDCPFKNKQQWDSAKRYYRSSRAALRHLVPSSICVGLRR